MSYPRKILFNLLNMVWPIKYKKAGISSPSEAQIKEFEKNILKEEDNSEPMTVPHQGGSQPIKL